jgi:hypothetical protein
MKVEEKRFEFFNETKSGFSTRLATTHKIYNPLRNLIPKDSFSTNNGGNPLTSFEVSLRLRFAYLERFLENHFFRSSLGSPYPVGELYITRGISGVMKSNYNYTKLSFNVSDYIKIPPLGSISILAYAGKTFGTLPYMLLDVAPGNEMYYYNKYSFNMMNRWEFIHDRYAGVNVEHIVGNGLFRFIPKLKFRQLWTAKVLWGGLSDKNRDFNFKQGHNFQTLDGKAYLELGTGVDNILKLLRVDFIWRVLPRPLPEQKSRRFGVFGSFRLSF